MNAVAVIGLANTRSISIESLSNISVRFFSFAMKSVVTALIAWTCSLWLTSQALAQTVGNNVGVGVATNVANSVINGRVNTNGSFWTRFVTSIKGVPVGARVGRARNGSLRWGITSGIPGIGGVINVGNTRGVGFASGEGYWDDAGIMEDAACRVLALPEGSFGALVMIVSGVIAVVASAMASYRVALAVLVVGLGSWLIYPVVTLFFGELCFF